MTATDELRRLLDEHDEYYKTSGNKTWWGRPIDRQTGKPINVFHYQAQPMGEDRLFVELQLATPEQAIAATLDATDAKPTQEESSGTCRIADRIDAEHEAMLVDARKTVYQGYVELPKDADGEYIHVGDILDGYGKTIEVVEMRYGRSGWVLISRDGNGYADTFAFTHHAPTVEDVLREFGIDWEYESDCEDRAALLKDYAAKLRLAKEDA